MHSTESSSSSSSVSNVPWPSHVSVPHDDTWSNKTSEAVSLQYKEWGGGRRRRVLHSSDADIVLCCWPEKIKEVLRCFVVFSLVLYINSEQPNSGCINHVFINVGPICICLILAWGICGVQSSFQETSWEVVGTTETKTEWRVWARVRVRVQWMMCTFQFSF